MGIIKKVKTKRRNIVAIKDIPLKHIRANLLVTNFTSL